ncbi:hypothetical protein KGF57_002599 [Candida theae]|uniref:Uncharacterized protein n=1 Tax=Candida theae TaxID=1198502 RepID=A0AAD5FYM5_9ASCO|nr:uncharacterized protein KGF57_002599 [Candida theae]KAI5958244.1 hypothetical protein KGF57_002599 [Candida theae]
MSLPHDAILDMLNQVELGNSNTDDELILMIRDKLLEASEESNIVLLAQFSKSLYTIKKPQLLFPALELYQADKPVLSKIPIQASLEMLVDYYKYTFFNLVHILVDHPTEAIKAQTKLFAQIYKKLNTEEKPSDEELLYASMANSVDDLCNDRKAPPQFSNEIKTQVKNQNTFVAIRHLFQNSGINRIPVSSFKSLFEVDDVSAVFEGQESLHYEIVDDVLVLETKRRQFAIEEMVATQVETAKLTQRLKDTS